VGEEGERREEEKLREEEEKRKTPRRIRLCTTIDPPHYLISSSPSLYPLPPQAKKDEQKPRLCSFTFSCTAFINLFLP